MGRPYRLIGLEVGAVAGATLGVFTMTNNQITESDLKWLANPYFLNTTLYFAFAGYTCGATLGAIKTVANWWVKSDRELIDNLECTKTSLEQRAQTVIPKPQKTH